MTTDLMESLRKSYKAQCLSQNNDSVFLIILILLQTVTSVNVTAYLLRNFSSLPCPNPLCFTLRSKAKKLCGLLSRCSHQQRKNCLSKSVRDCHKQWNWIFYISECEHRGRVLGLLTVRNGSISQRRWGLSWILKERVCLFCPLMKEEHE